MINETLFSKKLWIDCRPMYAKILDHPFILELRQGTLSKDRFAYYMQQDSLYLIDFARALAYIAAKIPGTSEMISFLQFALGAIVGERELHDDYFKHYQIIPSNEKNDACTTYTDYLISTAATQSVEEAIAAVLPCFWVYHEVGAYVFANSVSNNPYEKWINTYSNEEFSLLVNQALEIAENTFESASPEVRLSMKKAAQQSVYLEWRFWDNAYDFKEHSCLPRAF